MKILPFFFALLFTPLRSQTDDSWKVYSDSTLARIDITIDSTALAWIYSHVESDSEHAASFRFRNGLIDESVDMVGFRLRGNTSREAKKKSFKVSFNSFVKGKKFHGIEKLNLNGEHNDPSIIRSKLAFDLYRDIGAVASRANHAVVYINGTFYGVYVSVEHVDEEFVAKHFADDSGNLWKCLYPADLVYLGSDPNQYKSIMHGSERAYELTTNESEDDYSAFVRLVGIINNTPAAALADSLERVMHVSRLLQYFAVNTLVGSWDDYRSLKNNYYLYHEPSEGKFTLIPYDYDNSFGIDWFSIDWTSADPYNYPTVQSIQRPLWSRIIADVQYRDLYTHFLRFYHENVFGVPRWEARMNRLKDSLTAAAANDTYRTLDYGFTLADFLNSYSSVSYKKLHVKRGIGEFVNLRNSTLAPQLNTVGSAPIVYCVDFPTAHPQAGDTLVVDAACFGTAGIKSVALQITPAGSAMNAIPMILSPVPGTMRVEEHDRWRGAVSIPNGTPSAFIRIAVTDSLDRTVLYPRADSMKIRFSSAAAPSLVINEFMADNTTIADPAGQYDDWVEVYNPTSEPVRLTGKFITDKPGTLTKWKFTQPDLVVAPGEHRIIWCDEEPEQEGIHAGIKLSAGGEYIAITDSDGVTVLDSITFGPQRPDISFGRFPDGSAQWGPMSPTPLASNSAVMRIASTDALPLYFDAAVFPNPFNPSTSIQYRLPKKGSVILEIVDIMGRSVWKSIHNERPPGMYTVRWNGRTDGGIPVSSGVYLLVIRNGEAVRMKKLLLLK